MRQPSPRQPSPVSGAEQEVREVSLSRGRELESEEEARQGLTIKWLGISEVVSLNPSNWQL